METKVLKETNVEIAAKTLSNGEILVFPTETVYGVGIIYNNEKSYNDLINLKKRPPKKPFSMMCSTLGEAFRFANVSCKAKALMIKYLPGELTVLVNAKEGLPEWVTLGTGIIGIRVPDSKYVQELIAKVGQPCLVTSANISGQKTTKEFEEAFNVFNGQVPYIVNGSCTSEVPSTIVDLTDDNEIKLIREGGIPFKDIEEYWRSLDYDKNCVR